MGRSIAALEVSNDQSARLLMDWLALAFGLVVGPVLAWQQVGLDILWTGLGAGTAAYAVHRLRKVRA